LHREIDEVTQQLIYKSDSVLLMTFWIGFELPCSQLFVVRISPRFQRGNNASAGYGRIAGAARLTDHRYDRHKSRNRKLNATKHKKFKADLDWMLSHQLVEYGQLPKQSLKFTRSVTGVASHSFSLGRLGRMFSTTFQVL
jgi:hypothetical protein